MIEKGSPAVGEFDAARAAAKQLRADLIFEISDLTAERRLRRVQPFLGRDREASLLCDRDEIAKVPQLHSAFHISEACPSAYKVFFWSASASLYTASTATRMEPVCGLSTRCQSFRLAMLRR